MHNLKTVAAGFLESRKNSYKLLIRMPYGIL